MTLFLVIGVALILGIALRLATILAGALLTFAYSVVFAALVIHIGSLLRRQDRLSWSGGSEWGATEGS